jgi:hypothetical protein
MVRTYHGTVVDTNHAHLNVWLAPTMVRWKSPTMPNQMYGWQLP